MCVHAALTVEPMCLLFLFISDKFQMGVLLEDVTLCSVWGLVAFLMAVCTSAGL